MTMGESVRTVFSKYVTFSGRATRSEFWWWVLFTIIVSIVLGIIDAAIIGPILGYPMFAQAAPEPLSGLFALAILLPGLAVSARRLHDIDRSGWWILLNLIPLIGFIVLIYWYTRPSDPGTNRFG